MPPLETQVASRKQRRKEDRRQKKSKQHHVKAQMAGTKRSAPKDDDHRIHPRSTTGRSTKMRKDPTFKAETKRKSSLFEMLDEDTAAALRRDDEEIAELERKLGSKKNLNQEYAAEEGYGDDFGDFLDSLDQMVTKVVVDKEYDPSQGILAAGEDEDGQEDDSEEEDEEEVPMKPAASEEEPDEDSSDEDDDVSLDINEIVDDMQDHDESLTYTPVAGEDIYGKAKDSKQTETTTKKYVPPHLRNPTGGREDNLRAIQRLLNNALNRLSEETLVSVIQAISGVYQSYPATDVNESIWQIVHNSCVARGSQIMKGLIPLYVAAIRGLVIQGASPDLGSFVLESAVRELWTALEKARASLDNKHTDEEVAKESSNLVLICCYLYNFDLIHCSLMYDLVRNLIQHFTEADIENLLLILSHSGRVLRSDDPSALKEIVSLVQRTSREKATAKTNTARVEFMLSAMLDLKNNKRRKQNEAITDNISRFRKMLGHIKTASKGVSRGGDASLRISLADILNVETKGRWWKVGASWSGNNLDGNKKEEQEASNEKQSQQFDDKLLKLADKYRMNTDSRRAAFCIIMGAEDYEDCFEKLIRAGMLKNRVERDTVRVLLECCGNEPAFNKFYSHLAVRLCEYQSQCKFSIQLSFFDIYKRFDEVTARKAANLAKLLFELVVLHNCLRFTAIKPIDIASPETLSENEMIFITIFLTNVLEHFEDPGDAKRCVQSIRNSQGKGRQEDEEDEPVLNDGQALQASLTVFLVQVMKSSPKYKKGSLFRNNLKAMVKACDPVDDAFMD